MLTRQFIFQHDDESNAAFEKRVNELFEKQNALFKDGDHMSHDVHISKNNKIFMIVACKFKENEPNKVGF